MPTDPLRSKALACLREGRVTVLGVKLDEKWRPVSVVARVLSSRDRHPYRVRIEQGKTSCNCRDGMNGDRCPHGVAVALVTSDGASS